MPLPRYWSSLVFTVGFACAATGGSTLTANPRSESLFRQENLFAWCIVPFDSVKRGPAERIAMLKRLGFSQYVWDWRDEHLPILKEEIALARENGIQMRAVWIWIERGKDDVGKLSEANRFIFDTFAEEKLPVEYWVGFHENFFEGLSDDESVKRGAAMIAFLAMEAAKSGGTVALYNHGGWFGEPENEIKIIQAVDNPSVGMVFNFHHAHTMIDRFPELLPKMLPHLKAIDLNGMRPEGPKIIPIGQGSHEVEMIKLVVASGYEGPIGILGHIDDEDVEIVLARNLAGLRALVNGELRKGN
jgi:sugar phosphate isomerase/epimerase